MSNDCVKKLSTKYVKNTAGNIFLITFFQTFQPITIFPTFSRLNGDPEYLAWKSLVKKIKSRSWRNGENLRAKKANVKFNYQTANKNRFTKLNRIS